MKLTYRGVSYDYTPPAVDTVETEDVGKYRGLEWRFRKTARKVPVLQSNLDLMYRGVAYRTGQTVAAPAAEPVAEPVAELTPAVASTPTTKTASVEARARVLMMNHHTWIKNREQSLLGRAAAEVGLPVEASHYWSQIQGKINPAYRASYDRSHASLS